MVNLKAGAEGVVITFVVLLLECILFPIALIFLSIFNASAWLGTNDRTILATSSTIMVVTLLFTLISGMIGSIYVSFKG